MSSFLIHVSHLQNSPVSFGGNVTVNFRESSSEIWDLPIRSLELYRRLIAGLCREWGSDEEMYRRLTDLMNQNRLLEEEAAGLLNL